MTEQLSTSDSLNLMINDLHVVVSLTGEINIIVPTVHRVTQKLALNIQERAPVNFQVEVIHEKNCKQLSFL